MSKVLSQAARLLALTRTYGLNWSPAEQRLVDQISREELPTGTDIRKRLQISDERVAQLLREIVDRLTPVERAAGSREFDRKNVKTWPIVLLRLDNNCTNGRRLERKLLARHLTMVAQLLGRDSPLTKPEFRKGLGTPVLRTLEEKLKSYGLVDELAWRVSVADSRRLLQDEIERRIRDLDRR
jgi:hypothetical protein